MLSVRLLFLSLLLLVLPLMVMLWHPLTDTLTLVPILEVLALLVLLPLLL